MMKHDNILTLRYDMILEQWIATYDESPQGFAFGAGDTPQEAVNDAIRQIKAKP